MIRKVHVVFKTHLDIGFTDFAGQVTRHYLDRFIPAAIRAAEEMNADEARPPRFVWTVGAYLIDLALRTLDAQSAGRLERAVQKGHIAYHAMPFTTHSELCSPEVFDAGLQIAKRLDERFGRKTIAAKMSDVPGHTSGIIGPLQRHGVAFLHIGINTVAGMPKVPPLFMWENNSGERVMVNYTRSYGGLTLFDGHDEALYFLHSDDNSGPPTVAFLDKAYADIEKRFPGAQVFASTLDAFARGLAPLKDSLPVIRGEIGDTWIHGVGTDPYKTSILRGLERLCRQWDEKGAWAKDSADRQAFLERLLLVCEHTWGLDLKKYLTDFKNWDRPDFERARTLDKLSDAYGLGQGYDDCFHFARDEFEKLKPDSLEWTDRSYSLFEASHQEQREYLDQAIVLLPETLKAQAQKELAEATPAWPQGRASGPQKQLGAFELHYQDGAVQVSKAGKPLVAIRPPLYQRVGLDAFDKLASHYLTDMDDNRQWAVPDNLKPGAEHSSAPKQDENHAPCVEAIWETGESWHLEGSYPEAPHQHAGCPKRFHLTFKLQGNALEVAAAVLQKPADRRPEALFVPISAAEERPIALQKISEWVKPQDMIQGGNRRVHAVQAVRFDEVQILPLDCPLVCLFSPKLLDFEGEAANGQVYFCLYNNLWGTNFKMWYNEDILSRFLIQTSEGEDTHEI